MQTCSNCGAAVRSGAKFCTKCGTRLNTAPPQETQEQWNASPTPDADTTDVEAPEASDTASDTWDWTSTSDAPEEAGAEETEPPTDEDPPEWAASWVSGPPDDTNTSEREEQPASLRFADREADPLTGMTVEPPPSPTETDLTSDERDEEDLVTLEDVERDSSASTWAEDSGVAGDQDTGALFTGEPAAASAPETDVQKRAEALVRELSEVLPMLAASPASGNTAVADALESAIGDTSRYDTLRDTLRSIDTTHRSFDDVLKLVDQAETLNALQEDYDRLVAATQAAITTLRGEGDEA